MISIDTRSPVAIYEQIKSGFRGLVARGLLRPGDQAPAIRNLAQTLLINPNTIARAYRRVDYRKVCLSRGAEKATSFPHPLREKLGMGSKLRGSNW